MNNKSIEIIETIRRYIESNPEVRFSQALFNLNINQFEDKDNPSNKGFLLRDIYNDSDEAVLDRIKRNR